MQPAPNNAGQLVPASQAINACNVNHRYIKMGETLEISQFYGRFDRKQYEITRRMDIEEASCRNEILRHKASCFYVLYYSSAGENQALSERVILRTSEGVTEYLLLFPLDSMALTSRDNPHFEYAFRPQIPGIPRFPWGLWNFCSHFVANGQFTSKPEDTTASEYQIKLSQRCYPCPRA